MWSSFLIFSFESVNKLLWRVRAVFLSVVIAKQKQLLWPITTDTNNTMNQSKRQANTCNRRQARNDCEHVRIGLVSLLIGWESEAVFFLVFFLPTAEQSMAKPKQMQITFHSQLKTTLFWTWFQHSKTCLHTVFVFLSSH